MKAQYALIGILIMSAAHSAEFGVYANSVSAHNIAAAQHEIANHIFVPMGKTLVKEHTSAKPVIEQNSDRYGEMLYYGEFGDDTGVLPLVSGHNGGDDIDEHLRIGWQHFSDNIKFKSYPHAKNTADLAFVAYGNEFDATRVEFFAGYSGAHTQNDVIDIDTDGGFVGASFGKKFGKLELMAMADIGIALNDMNLTVYGDDFHNFYAGIMAHAAYSYSFDGDFFLRPAFRAGCTWINSASYISTAGNNIENQDVGFFELTPSLDIFSDIDDGFSIGAHAGYVMNFRVGGQTQVNYVNIPKLNIKNYFEYGIIVSQDFDGFSLNLNIGRHDGAHSGWNGGVEFKYVF